MTSLPRTRPVRRSAKRAERPAPAARRDRASATADRPRRRSRRPPRRRPAQEAARRREAEGRKAKPSRHGEAEGRASQREAGREDASAASAARERDGRRASRAGARSREPGAPRGSAARRPRRRSRQPGSAAARPPRSAAAAQRRAVRRASHAPTSRPSRPSARCRPRATPRRRRAPTATESAVADLVTTTVAGGAGAGADRARRRAGRGAVDARPPAQVLSPCVRRRSIHMPRTRRDRAPLAALLCTGAWCCACAVAARRPGHRRRRDAHADPAEHGRQRLRDAGHALGPRRARRRSSARSSSCAGRCRAGARRRAILQRLDPRRGWRNVARTRVRSTERFVARWRADRSGRISLRVVVARRAGAAAGGARGERQRLPARPRDVLRAGAVRQQDLLRPGPDAGAARRRASPAAVRHAGRDPLRPPRDHRPGRRSRAVQRAATTGTSRRRLPTRSASPRRARSATCA